MKSSNTSSTEHEATQNLGLLVAAPRRRRRRRRKKKIRRMRSLKRRNMKRKRRRTREVEEVDAICVHVGGEEVEKQGAEAEGVARGKHAFSFDWT